MDDGNAAVPAQEDTAATHRAWRDVTELAVGYALILAVIWSPRPLQRALYCATAAVLAAILCGSFPGWKTMGLRSANLASSAWVAGVALLLSAIAILLAARMHTLLLPGGVLPFVRRYLGYAIWTFLQQILLQDFFLLRLLRLIRRPGSAALAAATLFSLAHLPNPILVVVTFVWGIAACLLFLHYRNLYPLAAAHAILGITLAMTVPGPVTHNMRVGLGYLTYSSHPLHHRNH